MTRSLVLAAALGFSLLTACGGGEAGDRDAFCAELESLAEKIADGDLATERGLTDITEETFDELFQTAPDDQVDIVDALGEELERVDPDDAAETFETIEDELGDAFEDCDVDLEEPEVPETTTTTAPPDTTTTAAPDTTTTTIDGGGGVDEIPVNARQPVPAGTQPEFAPVAQACFDGDMAACDELFLTTPVDSVEEAYGETCGGRLAEARANQCASLVTVPVDLPAEVVDQAAGAACFAGDMVACDDLFRGAADATIDQAYGGLCGGRVQNTEVFCVDIFGEVAFQ